MIEWVKAFHVIAMVTWFAGLFYLPRLFVYHTQVSDDAGNIRFKTMERKLYFYITTPGGIITTFLGLWLISFDLQSYSHMLWLQIKLILVGLLWIFHIYCGLWLKKFKHDKNKHTEKFYRIINEVPTIILIIVVILAYVKPTA